MRAAIYLRQSLDRDGKELAIDRQREACERLVAARGYQLAETIIDNNRSATKGPRPGFERLQELIKQRAIGAVVVLRVDRLLRTLLDLEHLITLVEQSNVLILTVEGDLDLSTPMGRQVARILASIARGEVETKSARQKLANAQRAQAGQPHKSHRPFGYEADAVTIKESEAAAIQEMARRIIAGHTYRDVTYWANQEGYTTTTGRPFEIMTIRGLLRNKRYIGIRTYNGEEYPAVWQPILDPGTFQAVQLATRERSERYADVPKGRKYLLTGIAFCGICGGPLTGHRHRDRPTQPVRRAYICHDESAFRREQGCGRIRRNADALEDWIKEAVIYRLDTPALSELRHDKPDNDLSGLLADFNAQKVRLNALVDDYALNLLSREQFSRAKAVAEAELQRIEADIDTYNRQRLGLDLPAGTAVREAWDNGTDDWRRSLLRLLIKRITVNPGHTKPVYKQWRFDPSLIQVDWLS